MARINGDRYVARSTEGCIAARKAAVVCPKCGNGVLHPDGKNLLIQVASAYNQRGGWARCLVCSGFYTAQLMPQTWVQNSSRSGWFLYN